MRGPSAADAAPAGARRGLAAPAAAPGPPVLVQEADTHAVVTLNRPASLNALSSEVAGALLQAVARLDACPQIAAIVITGAGGAFAAGADIRELAALESPEQAAAARPFESLDRLLAAARSTPLIAAVNGYALGGGCELAMACDVVVAGERAVFGLPELRLGVVPAFGATQRLPRLVGRALASDMVLTGRRLSAAEALAAGLVSRVAADPLAEASAIAAAIAAGASRRAAAAAVAALRESEGLPLPAGLARERALFYSCFGSDQVEGMAAFLGKRRPQFRGGKPDAPL
ncbi:hypothetical protein Rsub_12733 [Raphidocelis subcapitata]|uniref:Enoyl-hydratase n=1 Tax=Raphidocelis subcapitata TaxID=307507 RepID=A0A2V0PJY8_9CHLO|nr:hypothetical protein Rsub_12733 [Raphidocelis subcapitata]|eukprot:GBG00122.1 hypothetical protein Rsub_12733 [Raphidocelis subcapitata]